MKLFNLIILACPLYSINFALEKEQTMLIKDFASDNHAGIHPEVLKAINDVNHGYSKAYGNDEYTKQAIELFKKHFGSEIDVYFVLTGTGANILSLKSLLKPFEAVICAESAHINVHECGGSEQYVGCKLLTVPTEDGKLTVEKVKNFLSVRGNSHVAQPKVISITQCTELGTVYTAEEIKQITEFAHANDMYVHMDGARFCNAVASLNTTLKAISADVGVDVLSFGGTKNGLMIGEAIIFFNKDFSKDFKYLRVQGMQTASKMRFIAAQFHAYFSNDLWQRNASHANNMAHLLAQELGNIPQVKISRKVQSNVVFVCINPSIVKSLQEKCFFYVWDEATSEVRLMTSWDTTEKDVMNFIENLSHMIKFSHYPQYIA